MPAPRILAEGIRDEVVLALAAGGFLEEVAGRVGVTKQTLVRWRHEGEAVAARVESGETAEEELSSYEALELSFFRGVSRARSSAVVRAQAAVQAAMQSNWRAAAWYLERSDPGRWGRFRTAVEEVDEEADLDSEAQAALLRAAKDWKDRKERQASRRAAGE